MAEITLSSSSLYTLQKCERRAYFSEKFQVLRDWNWPLEFGSAIHAIMAEYDSQWQNGLDARVNAGLAKALQIASEWDSWREDSQYNSWNLCRVPVWNAEHYGLDEFCVPHGGSEIEFNIPFEGLVFRGYLDGLVKTMGRYYIRDRKTTSQQLGDSFFSKYSPDVQFSAYIWAGRKLWPELKIAGVICEGIQIGTGWIDFCRVPILRCEDEINDFEDELRYFAKRKVELWNQPINKWIKSESACYGCPFRRPCSSPNLVRDSYNILPRDGDNR